MDTSVEADVRLELNDYMRANYWFCWMRRRWLKIFLVALAIVGIALYVVELIVIPKEAVGAGLLLLLLPALLLFQIACIYFGGKRHFVSNRELREVRRYSFSDEGIKVTGTSFSGQTTWANIREAWETRPSFLLFPSDRTFHIVPKRCFQRIEHVARFKEILRFHLGSKAKLQD